MSNQIDRPSEHGPHDAPDSRLADRFKEFWMSTMSVNHTTSVLVLFFIIAVMGVLSYQAIPKESFPEIVQPMFVVNTIYPGVSPADVESQVTRVLEEDLSTISDLDELRSTSVEGYSSITVAFESTVDVQEALTQVREKVDLAKPDLPADVQEPTIVEFDFAEIPIMSVNLSGEYGLVRLKQIAEELQDRLETLPGVLRADVRGGLEQQVKVDVDLGRLQYYGVSMSDVVAAIQTENVNIPGGSIDVGETKYLVRVDGELDDPTVIEDFVVSAEDGRPIYVRDVATVDFGFAERESFARMGGDPVVTLDVVKRSGSNIIETAEAVGHEIELMRPDFPPTTEVSITADQSRQIEMMVESLGHHIIMGMILIVAVLFFFLGLRTSMLVAVSIPTSLLLSFITFRLLGISLNMIVLFSLILALGMLVDDAIVVVENIYRFIEQGWERKLAVKKATGEVAIPVISSTATTLAAFLPLIFWPGQIGDFMGYLPITLVITLTASLVVAFTIVPTLCAIGIQLEGTKPEPLKPAAKWTLIGLTVVALLWMARSNVLTVVLLVATAGLFWALYHFFLERIGHQFRQHTVAGIIARYERVVRWALGHRLAVVGITILSFIGVGTLFGLTHSDNIEFFPEDIPPTMLMVDVETPVGTRAAVTDAIVRSLEAELEGVGGREDWESVVAVTGGSGGGGAAMMGGGGPSGPEGGRISVSMVEFEERQFDAWATLADMQASVGHEVAGATVTVQQLTQGPAGGTPVTIEIVGEDPAMLRTLSDQVVEILRNAPVAPRLVGLESDLDAARPELSVVVDRERAALYNLSTLEVGSAIRVAINGVEAAKYRTGNDEYDIIVRLAEPYRQELEGLRELTVMNNDGTQVPLVSIASWQVQEGMGAIRRKDQTRMATITSNVAAGNANNVVLAEVQETLTDFGAGLPPGYTMQYAGQSTEQTEAADFLQGAFMAAVMLISLILISQFNSVVKPAIIMTGVLMSTMGVFIGLMVLQMPFSVIMGGIGIVALAGIVVKNGIILIDYIDILRERDGMDRREALVLAGKTRFRPVLLTASTAALGLMSLAIGLNFDFVGLYTNLDPNLYFGGEQAGWWGSMAVSIISGILCATVLTLILAPVMYSLVDDAEVWVRHHFANAAPAVGLARGGAVEIGRASDAARLPGDAPRLGAGSH
ncbi:MAG: efflux RND transporter permease subunit [Gemmatimonadetes bacterium]|nr:efflux RND transporter permease subunit [Gemmatimonadota bacterium]